MRYSMCKREYPELHTENSTSQSTPYFTEQTLKYNPLERRVYSLCLAFYTSVYDIVNESVYQVYLKFRIQIRNSEFGIQNCEFSLK